MIQLNKQPWHFQNPVQIIFADQAFLQLPELVRERPYVLVTYPDSAFTKLASQLSEQAEPLMVINNIRANPDLDDIEQQWCQLQDLQQQPQLIVALGGGSVLDTAKALSASLQDFEQFRQQLQHNEEISGKTCPLIAIPTTAGTGSEVTCWGTVWHRAAGKKYSVKGPALYPEIALIDPELTRFLPLELTRQTALDALSHALESIWNKNRNPISDACAIQAAKIIIEVLPELLQKPEKMKLRRQMAEAALLAGMAFSNTQTAIAHALSYPLTLSYDLPHGIACSFTLPQILTASLGRNNATDSALSEIFGTVAEAETFLSHWLNGLGVSTHPDFYGIDPVRWPDLVNDACYNPRGQNWIGDAEYLELLLIRHAQESSE